MHSSPACESGVTSEWISFAWARWLNSRRGITSSSIVAVRLTTRRAATRGIRMLLASGWPAQRDDQTADVPPERALTPAS
jgi:hypothetical protein